MDDVSCECAGLNVTEGGGCIVVQQCRTAEACIQSLNSNPPSECILVVWLGSGL